MLEILQWIITEFLGDAALTALVNPKNIYTGPVDVLVETQPELHMPMIVLSTVSEQQRTVPQGARDTHIQLDIYSRVSMMQVEQIYEEILNLLPYKIADKSTAHIFWDRLEGAVDFFETDRRIWHKSVTMVFWSIKP